MNNKILLEGPEVYGYSFDIKRRKPVQTFDDIIEKWSLCKEESINHIIAEKIEAIEHREHELKFKINKYDTDMIKRVNNIGYLQWAIESIPDNIIDEYYLYSIDGKFTSEAHYGQTVISMTKQCTTDSTGQSFIHSIQIEGTDKVYARAKDHLEALSKAMI